MSKIILSAENKSIYLDRELNCSRLATLLERVNNKTFNVNWVISPLTQPQVANQQKNELFSWYSSIRQCVSYLGMWSGCEKMPISKQSSKILSFFKCGPL